MKPLQITDPEILARLQSNGPVDVADASGRVIGRIDFKPMTFPEFGITDEEFERMVNDPAGEWVPAAEVDRRLREHLNGRK